MDAMTYTTVRANLARPPYMYVLLYNTALHLSSKPTAMPYLSLKRDAQKTARPLAYVRPQLSKWKYL